MMYIKDPNSGGTTLRTHFKQSIGLCVPEPKILGPISLPIVKGTRYTYDPRPITGFLKMIGYKIPWTLYTRRRCRLETCRLCNTITNRLGSDSMESILAYPWYVRLSQWIQKQFEQDELI